MPKKVPKYGLHKRSGQARVYVNRQHISLGKYGTPESKRRYREVIAEWRAAQNAKKSGLLPDITIGQLADVYLAEHVAVHFRKNGAPTSEINCIKAALAPLLESHAETFAADFGPLALEAVRNEMIARNWARSSINVHVGRIRRMFKWAAAKEMVNVNTYQALQTLPGLQKGRCNARESDPVFPVPDAHIDVVRPLVPSAVRALIELQLTCGCRPGEALGMRGIDLNMSGEIWEYRPAEHKTEHHGRERVIFLGPRSQEIIRPFLTTDLQAYLFVPTGRECKYRVDSYRRCISRACKQAGIPVWSPNQLRHNAGTEIRREYGLEAAQVILGHSKADVTQVYAERDLTLARDIARKLG